MLLDTLVNYDNSQKKEQDLSELRVMFWMMPGDLKCKPTDQYRIVFEEKYAQFSCKMTPMYFSFILEKNIVYVHYLFIPINFA